MANKNPLVNSSGRFSAADFIEPIFCVGYRFAVGENFQSKGDVLSIGGDEQISDVKGQVGNLLGFTAVSANTPNL